MLAVLRLRGRGQIDVQNIVQVTIVTECNIILLWARVPFHRYDHSSWSQIETGFTSRSMRAKHKGAHLSFPCVFHAVCHYFRASIFSSPLFLLMNLEVSGLQDWMCVCVKIYQTQHISLINLITPTDTQCKYGILKKAPLQTFQNIELSTWILKKKNIYEKAPTQIK